MTVAAMGRFVVALTLRIVIMDDLLVVVEHVVAMLVAGLVIVAVVATMSRLLVGVGGLVVAVNVVVSRLVVAMAAVSGLLVCVAGFDDVVTGLMVVLNMAGFLMLDWLTSILTGNYRVTISIKPVASITGLFIGIVAMLRFS